MHLATGDLGRFIGGRPGRHSRLSASVSGCVAFYHAGRGSFRRAVVSSGTFLPCAGSQIAGLPNFPCHAESSWSFAANGCGSRTMRRNLSSACGAIPCACCKMAPATAGGSRMTLQRPSCRRRPRELSSDAGTELTRRLRGPARIRFL